MTVIFEYEDEQYEMKPIKRRSRPVKAKCMNCTAVTTITDKDQPCPVCMLCGSLAWQDLKGLSNEL